MSDYIIENSEDVVIMRNDLAVEVAFDIAWKNTPGYDEYQELFEYVGNFLANDDFYQGLNKITVIRRKSDGKLFGYEFFYYRTEEPMIESNGAKFGLDYIELPEPNEAGENYYDFYVWLPVEEISIPGYRVIKEDE